MDDLDREIIIDGKPANKMLDIRIPEGTKNNLDLEGLFREAKEKGIKLIIKEFK